MLTDITLFVKTVTAVTGTTPFNIVLKNDTITNVEIQILSKFCSSLGWQINSKTFIAQFFNVQFKETWNIE